MKKSIIIYIILICSLITVYIVRGQDKEFVEPVLGAGAGAVSGKQAFTKYVEVDDSGSNFAIIPNKVTGTTVLGRYTNGQRGCRTAINSLCMDI